MEPIFGALIIMALSIGIVLPMSILMWTGAIDALREKKEQKDE